MVDFDTIRTHISIYEILDMYGIRYRLKGLQESFLCPFHQDTSPSCRIYPEYNLLYCYGSCHRSFDVLAFVMQQEGFTDPVAAAKLLEEHFNIPELEVSYVTKFWRQLDSTKRSGAKRDFMQLAFAMQREIIAKYWPEVRVEILTPIWVEYSKVLERIRTGEVSDSTELRKWYADTCERLSE